MPAQLCGVVRIDEFLVAVQEVMASAKPHHSTEVFSVQLQDGLVLLMGYHWEEHFCLLTVRPVVQVVLPIKLLCSLYCSFVKCFCRVDSALKRGF